MIEERQSSIQKSYDLLNVLSRERLEILQVIINLFYVKADSSLYNYVLELTETVRLLRRV